MHSILIKNLKKSFKEHKIFLNFNLEIKGSRIIAFFGNNGCGKSTLFNLISGASKQDEGEIFIKNFDRTKFSYMFQNYSDSLLPWRKNFDNLAFPLQIQGLNEEEIRKQIEEIYSKYNFNINLSTYSYELSGGQKQFLLFLRSIITKPTLLLLDEPFSALDYENSLLLSNKLQEYYLATRSTILVITHDIEEAVYLADEIIVLSHKPSQILGRVKNTLPYPRDLNVLQSKEFNEVKNKVLQLFQFGVKL